MKTPEWTRLLATTSLLILGACGGGSSDEPESSTDAVEVAERAAFRDKVEGCDGKATTAGKLACFTAVNDVENAHLDKVQSRNYPGVASTDYLTSDIPVYRDGALKLCNVLAGKPVDSKDAPDAVMSCLAQRERDLSALILAVVYGDASDIRAGSFGGECREPADVSAAQPSGRALKDETNAMERWSDCLKDKFSESYRAKVSATFDVCSPARSGETSADCRAMSVFDWSTRASVDVCRVLGTAAHVGMPYEIMRAQNECVGKSLALLEGTLR